MTDKEADNRATEATDLLERIYEVQKRQLHVSNVISGYLGAIWWTLIAGTVLGLLVAGWVLLS